MKFPAKMLLLAGALAIACRPAATAPAARDLQDAELRRQLNPVNQVLPEPKTVLTAPPPLNLTTMFAVSTRPWLPPAETFEAQRLLAGDIRISDSAPLPVSEQPMLAALISPPERPAMVVPALPQTAGPDPARLIAWVVSNPATELRGRPPAWDRPQPTTDPTAAASRELALAPPAGLRETPPPFERLNIPDPFDQITIAELRTPPPENDPPVPAFNAPPLRLVETAAGGK